MTAQIALHVVLAAVAFATATLSGIIGMGGGMLLLATLFCFLPHGEAVPAHAAVQLVSNTTRVLGFLSWVDWPTLGRFCLGAVPGAVLGAGILFSLGQPVQRDAPLKLMVGMYILIVALLPKTRGSDRRGKWWDFPVLGAAAGVAGLTIGAVGPLIAPLFTRRGFVKERLVATKAACQAVLHVLKIPAFLWLGSLDYARLGTLTALMILMVIPGTMLGKRLLRRVSEERFDRLYKITLVAAGLKVAIHDGLWRLL